MDVYVMCEFLSMRVYVQGNAKVNAYGVNVSLTPTFCI